MIRRGRRAENGVIEWGQESDRRRCSGVGERGAGDVEQFPALLVFEDPQLVPPPAHDLAETGATAPGLDVRDGGDRRQQIARGQMAG